MHRDGTLDESKLEEGNKICLDAYKEWWHKERQDFFGLIVDIKTRKPNIPYDSVQLAGYGLLANTKLGLVERGLIDIEKPLFNPKLHFGGTPDYVEYNPESIAKYILYLKPKGGYEFVNAERNQATSLFRILLKKWWTDFDTQVIIEKWRKNK
jgi:hypothetical protein